MKPASQEIETMPAGRVSRREREAAESDAQLPAATSARAASAPWVRIAVAALLASYLGLALSAVRDKSPTFDEVDHIAAGYNIWVNGDFRFDPANGDFVKRWATLPLLWMRPNFPLTSDPDWRAAQFFVVGNRFLYHANNDADTIVFACRAMSALLGVALGFFVWRWSHELFDVRGGLLSLGLFALCPNLLGHGALVTTDVATALGFLGATWFLWRLLHRASWLHLAGSLALLGLLATTKLSVLLMVPIGCALAGARIARGQPWAWELGWRRMISRRSAQAAAVLVLVVMHALAALGAIWAIHDFRYAATRVEAADITMTPRVVNAKPVTGALATALRFARDYHLAPAAYLEGVEGTAAVSDLRPSYFAGKWQRGGQRGFFPYAATVKTPPALLLLLALAVFAWWRRGIGYEMIPLFAMIAIYGAVAVAQNLNIGFRHLLPIYPALYVLTGAAAAVTLRPGGVVLVSAAGMWFAADSLLIRPDYLAYFNVFAGGPARGYLRLADSSLDWGQDLPGVARWQRTSAARDEAFYFSYFGTAEPAHYGVSGRRLPGFPDWRPRIVYAYRPGIYAVSATMLNQLYSPCFGAWTPEFEARYQSTLRQLGFDETNTRDDEAIARALQRLPPGSWEADFARYEWLRFARLCAWLRQRPPDAEIGYSILLWRLDRASLHAALWSAGPDLPAVSR